MKSSKLLMTVFVAMLILSLTITTVGAQTGLPRAGEVDEDGDLIIGFFPPLDLEEADGLQDLDWLNIPEVETVQPEIQPDVPGPPTPIYPPADAPVYEKYPRFAFTEVVDATKYKVEVYDTIPEPDVLVYTLKGDGGDCSCGCNLSPTLPLKPWDILNTKGLYKWRVMAKWNGFWGDWSGFSSFAVLKNGFNTSFTTPTKAWYPVYGEWVLTSTGYAKTQGELHMMTSAIEKHVITHNFVYEVKMKRKNSDGGNFIFFQAYPFPLGADNFWDDGYLFTYRNNGDWALVKRENGANTLLWGTSASPYINPYDWNKITIKREGSQIKIWINEHYMDGPSDSTFTWGFVGFGMYKEDDVKDPLLVDWARLEYTVLDPYSVP